MCGRYTLQTPADKLTELLRDLFREANVNIGRFFAA